MINGSDPTNDFVTIYEQENRRRIHSSYNDNQGYLPISSKLQKKTQDENTSSRKLHFNPQHVIHFLKEKQRDLYFPRKFIFVIFISVSVYELMISQKGQVTSPHGKNPYTGVTPTYHKSQTSIKSQGVVYTKTDLGENHDDKEDDLDIDVNEESSIPLPESIRKLADVTKYPIAQNDIPFYFHIPRSGGSTVQYIMESCLGLVGASDLGALDEHESDSKTLEVITSREGIRYVNVDTTTFRGIEHAKELKLVERNLADYVVTPHIHVGAELFTEDHQGRMFTMMRDPIERSVSLFHHLSSADGEPEFDPSLATMSIEMWARSTDRVEHNIMTRFLSNNLKNDVTEQDLGVAKEVLRKKCLIGFLEAKGESMMRLQKYFNWEMNDPKSRNCVERSLNWGWSNKHAHPTIEVDSPTYRLLVESNKYDLELFEYAKRLFNAQSKMFFLQ